MSYKHPHSHVTRALLAVCLLASVIVVIGCDDGDGEASSTATPGSGTATEQATANTPVEPTPTLNPEQAATLVAALQDAPGISDTPEPGWQAEGEPGEEITVVCPASTSRAPFANEASLLLRGPDGQLARSGTAIFAEQSDTGPYTDALFADAAGCAGRLAQSWLGQAVTFSSGGTDAGIGDESLLVSSSGTPSATAIFFRLEEAVAALVVVGPDSEQAARDLAGPLEQQIIAKFEALSSGG